MGKKRKEKVKKSFKKKGVINRGKEGASSRGIGSGSRREFQLPCGWKTDVKVYRKGSGEGEKEILVSPGKTVYKTSTLAKEAIRKRDNNFEESTDESSLSEISEFEPSPAKKAKKLPLAGSVVKIERQLFVCESTQIADFVDSLNKTSQCSTDNCSGVLVPAKVETVGLGGSISIVFQCSGCQGRDVSFNGTSAVESSRRTVVGLSLAVAFIICGNGFAKFNKTLNQCLGIPAISKNRFYEVLGLMYPHVNDILCEMCESEKENMKAIESNILGSWKRAVVTSDGVWHTRGHFSKNGSFIIKNYVTGGLLWFGHKCMRGSSDDEELYEGTAKSMEGVLAEECYRQCKDEGADISIVWQDSDSSSKNSVEAVFGDNPQRVFKCGGHVGRAHANNLNDYAKMKHFSSTLVSRWKETFPEMEGLSCECKRHSKSCGCLSKPFILNAKINHFCCLQQCNDPQEYSRRLRVLSKYHCRDIHKWKGGECGFHPQTVCSCGQCGDENHTCKGKPYTTAHVIKCPFHHMAYRIECELRANDAESVIHPEMGRGQSNLCEAHFSVLPHFRPKNQSLSRLHYITSTNCGLIQGNMTWCDKNRGQDYHWVSDLYERLNLPVTSAVIEALKKANKDRMSNLKRKSSEKGNKQRISRKIARAEEQEERKKWTRRQAILHTYGDADVEDDEEDDHEVVSQAEGIVGGEDNNNTIVSGRKCKCGSTSHQRTSHHSCPYNKRKSM